MSKLIAFCFEQLRDKHSYMNIHHSVKLFSAYTTHLLRPGRVGLASVHNLKSYGVAFGALRWP